MTESLFHAALIKKKLWLSWFPMNLVKLVWHQSTKGKCVQKCIYISCVCVNQTCPNRIKLIHYRCCRRFMMWLKFRIIINQILFIGHLIKFIWILVLPSQGWLVECLFWDSSLIYHKCLRSLFQCRGSQVLGPIQNKPPGSRISSATFRALGIWSRVTPLYSVPGLESHL